MMDKNTDDDKMIVIDNGDWGDYRWEDSDSEDSDSEGIATEAVDRLHMAEARIDALDSTVDRLRGKVNDLKQKVGALSWGVIAVLVVLIVDKCWTLLSPAMGW